MTRNDLTFFREWFDKYTQSFLNVSKEDDRNYQLKIGHSLNVCRNIIQIAKNLSLDTNNAMLAETIALFHDIGRFAQYAAYKTFRDADSKNHGLLGVRILGKESVLQNLPVDEQEIINGTIKFHNAYALPTGQRDEILFFLKLIRDADKIDIFRVFIEYYETPEKERASATAFGVPDSPHYSKAMLSRIAQKKVASYSLIRTENDFRLMKLSWVFSMYFDESVRMVHGRGYIDNLIKKLPQTDDIATAMSILKSYVQQRLDNNVT